MAWPFRCVTSRTSPFPWQKCTVLALLLSSSETYGFTTTSIRQSHVSREFDPSQVPGHVRWTTSNSFEECLRQAFEESQTDGILSFAASLDESDLVVSDIVAASMRVSEGRSGDTASILNAWIGSCCLMDDRQIATKIAQGLIESFEELEESKKITPDLVAYSLAYSAFSRDPDAAGIAEYVLNKAVRKSKKLAGGKRRKALAASRRKDKVSCVGEIEEDLQRLCGDEFSVLYETNELLVLNKPSGIPCFHRKTTTAGKIRKGRGNEAALADDISLEDALIRHNVPLSTLNPAALGLVHRLDRGSSGCLVLAKTEEMHALLVAEFFLRRTQKKYKAIVAPAPDSSAAEEGIIASPVDGRPAKSYYRILERWGESGALLEFEIHTGRKHQIRVHASEGLSSPIYLDTMYGCKHSSLKNAEAADSKQRFFLHAATLRVPEQGIHVEAPLPKWWDTTISLFREKP